MGGGLTDGRCGVDDPAEGDGMLMEVREMEMCSGCPLGVADGNGEMEWRVL